jgi:uncharacterized protein involved in exopolysaccharide biosynthesis
MNINLIQLLKLFWHNRKIILIIISIFLFVGFIFVIVSPKEYRVDVLVLEENLSTSSSMSSLISQFGGLNGLSNINTNSNNQNLPYTLYPEIIKSTPFLLDVMNKKINRITDNSKIVISDYFNNYSKPSTLELIQKYTLGLPFLLKTLFTNSSIPTSKVFSNVELSQIQVKALNELKNRIQVKEGKIDNTLLFSFELQDKFLIVPFADTIINCLTKFATDYKIQKAKNDLEFIQSRCDEARKKYIIAQQTLADFQDNNLNLVLAINKAREIRLNSEYNIASNIYLGLAQQVEHEKIELQKCTPIFKVIEPPLLPNQKSKPQTLIILFFSIFLGSITGMSYVLYKSFF